MVNSEERYRRLCRYFLSKDVMETVNKAIWLVLNINIHLGSLRYDSKCTGYLVTKYSIPLSSPLSEMYEQTFCFWWIFTCLAKCGTELLICYQFPFPNFNCALWNIGTDNKSYPSLYNGYKYISMMGLKLNYVTKMDPYRQYCIISPLKTHKNSSSQAMSFILFIAWIRAVRHRTAVPHNSYHLRCMLEWSLSGLCGFCINRSAQNFKGWLRKTLNRRPFHLYQYLSCKFHSSFKPAWISLLSLVVTFNLYFENQWKKLLLLLGPPFRDRKSLETIPTQVKPNANRGWSIKPVNHIRPQLTKLCPNSSGTPTSQNADGALPYWGFQRYVSFIVLKLSR